MSTGEKTAERAGTGLAVVRRLRQRHLIDRIDYLRGLRRLARTMTQAELARGLGLTQPSISSALKSAHKVADPRPGFSGATPYEIAQRFTAGRLSREQLIDELARWDTEPWVGAGGLRPSSAAEASLADLRKAVRHGLLDQATYDAVMIRQRRLAQSDGSRRTTGRQARQDARPPRQETR